ncbi:MAG: FAD-binding protein [Eggerthellaceae bacterium]
MVGAGAARACRLQRLAGGRDQAPVEEAKPASEPAATAPAASNQPAFLTPPDPIPDGEIVETVDCDIVICGAGICGLPAAMLAAENGANVHVVEGSTYGLFRLCTAGSAPTCRPSWG